jgi:hypothetical protein
MKTIQKQAAQGDILIQRIEEIPEGTTEAKRVGGGFIVAESETHHHHMVHNKRVQMLMDGKDPLVCYLQVAGAHADLVHHRDVNPHETIRLPTGCWKITRQREWAPEGWRRVND